MKKTGFTHEGPTGGGHEWLTPKWIFDALGITFSLDPCAPINGAANVPAEIYFNKNDNGLKLPWSGSVWMNPPYGREIWRWTEKMVAHANGIALLPARTDTKWFHHAAPTADALLFPLARIDFIDAGKHRKNAKSHGAGAGAMLMAWGGDHIAALLRFRNARGGWYVEQHHV